MRPARTSARDAVEAEFSAYFSARFHQVRRLAYLLCGEWHRADDLAQSAFVRVASSWHRIRDPNAVDAYVRTCLMRAYLTEQRRLWRRREASTAEPPELGSGEDSAEAVADRVTMLRALAQLPPRQRAVLVCRYYDGLDVAGTAAVLGCTQGTVKSQSARGLATLRSVLTGRLAANRGGAVGTGAMGGGAGNAGPADAEADPEPAEPEPAEYEPVEREAADREPAVVSSGARKGNGR